MGGGGGGANPMLFHSLGELASEEPSDRVRHKRRYPTPLETSSSMEETSCPLLQRDRRRQQDLAGESWSAEGAPDSIGGGGSQAGSEESDGRTARWIGDQLRLN